MYRRSTSVFIILHFFFFHFFTSFLQNLNCFYSFTPSAFVIGVIYLSQITDEVHPEQRVEMKFDLLPRTTEEPESSILGFQIHDAGEMK